MHTAVNNNKRINRVYLIVWTSENYPRSVDANTPPCYTCFSCHANLFFGSFLCCFCYFDCL